MIRDRFLIFNNLLLCGVMNSLKPTWIADNPCYFLTGQSAKYPEVKLVNVLYETELEHLDFTLSDECIDVRFVRPAEIKDMHTFAGPAKLAAMFHAEIVVDCLF